MLPILLFGGLLLIGIVVIVIALAQSKRGSSIDDRLATFTDQTRSLEELELELPFSERVLQPLFQEILNIAGKVSPSKNAAKVKTNLEQAGNPGGLSPSMFTGMRLVMGIVGLGIGLLLVKLMGGEGFKLLLGPVLGGAIGYVLPGIWLGQKIKKRKHSILKSMPDALDLLAIAVEAGLGFDLALQRVADKWDNALSAEFTRVISDATLGVPRRDAMRAMADRCGVEVLTNFVQAIVQAEQLGVSIGKILKVQSEQMRIKRRQRAEELAHQAPIKMLFPMAFLIFPSILVVILGPAIPKIMGSGFGG